MSSQQPLEMHLQVSPGLACREPWSPHTPFPRRRSSGPGPGRSIRLGNGVRMTRNPLPQSEWIDRLRRGNATPANYRHVEAITVGSESGVRPDRFTARPVHLAARSREQESNRRAAVPSEARGRWGAGHPVGRRGDTVLFPARVSDGSTRPGAPQRTPLTARLSDAIRRRSSARRRAAWARASAQARRQSLGALRGSRR
jgi:hypothetical protein